MYTISTLHRLISTLKILITIYLFQINEYNVTVSLRNGKPQYVLDPLIMTLANILFCFFIIKKEPN